MENTILFSVKTYYIILLLLIPTTVISGEEEKDAAIMEEAEDKRSSMVFLAIIARNAAHLLPDYLGFLERLDYPKDSIAVQ